MVGLDVSLGFSSEVFVPAWSVFMGSGTFMLLSGEILLFLLLESLRAKVSVVQTPERA